MSDNQKHERQTQNPNVSKKKWFLLIENPSKSNHLGTLLRCAAAFQCHQVLLVGYDKFNCQGSFGSHLFLDIVAFHCWDAVMNYLNCSDCLNEGRSGSDEEANVERDRDKIISNEMQQQKISIVGILDATCGGQDVFSPEGIHVYEHSTGFASLNPPETVDEPSMAAGRDFNENGKRNSTDGDEQPSIHITKEGKEKHPCLPYKSHPIHTRPFSNHTCFLVSKRRSGLPIAQARLCDGFVHVPHLDIFGSAITTSLPQSSQIVKQKSEAPLLDAATTLSISLHHFTAWAGYSERQFEENQKFVKDTRPNRVRYLGVGKTYKKDEVSQHEDDDDGQEMNMAFWKSEGSSDY